MIQNAAKHGVFFVDAKIFGLDFRNRGGTDKTFVPDVLQIAIPKRTF